MNSILFRDSGSTADGRNVESLINEFFTDEQLMAILHVCLRRDIPDNNLKADIVTAIIADDDFILAGVGTNRVAYRHNGLIVKIALDRRGIVDNETEHRIAQDLPDYVAKGYESNYLVNIAEYVEVMSFDVFTIHQAEIRQCLENISKTHIFEDLGWNAKNYCNWGRRKAILTADERAYYGEYADEVYDTVALDCGYIYRIPEGGREELFRCPKCGSIMSWDINFTKIYCNTTATCNFATSPIELYERMDKTQENMISKLNAKVNNLTLEDFSDVTKVTI